MLASAAAVAFGASVFVLCVFVVYPSRSPIPIKTSADLQGISHGFYGIEHNDQLSYVWAGPHADLTVPGLDRRVGWRWHALAIIWRPETVPRPFLRVAVDGVLAFEGTITRDLTTIDVAIPKRLGAGVTLTFDASPGFVPGPGDRRQLGLAFSSISFEPARSAPQPPWRAVAGGVLALLFLGAALAVVGIDAAWILATGLIVAAAQVWPMTDGLAAYGSYPFTMAAVAGGLGLALVLIVLAIDARRGTRSCDVAGVAGGSAAVCYAKLLVLLHPGMPVGDGLFHAHRFSYVLAGRFYFTSLAPGDYAFPYPILLYLVAAPLSPLAPDTHAQIALLRVIVTIADAVAGAVLTWMVARTLNDRLAAAGTLVWYHAIPVTAWIMTWGNLTNAFGQTLFVMSLAVVASAVEWTNAPAGVLLAVLACAAFLSHPSTSAILATILALTACLYWWRDAAKLGSSARGVAVATTVAATAAFVLYYAWFPAVYARALGRGAAEVAARAAEPGSTLGTRIVLLVDLANRYFGWPAVVAASLGVWRLFADVAVPPRLKWLLVAWGGASLVFTVIGLVTPLELRYHFAAFPAVAILGALGWSWAWRRSLPFKLAAALVLAAAVWVGLRQWMAMLT